MSKRHILLALGLVAVAAAVFLGARAVAGFVKKPDRLRQNPTQIPTRLIENPYTPEIVPTDDAERRELREALESSAYRALLEINPTHRPTPAAARAIAGAFAEFVTICRTGTPEDHVAMVQSRGREPDKRFLDPERRDRFWKNNTGWAREAPLGIDQIWARPRYIRGTEIPVNLTRISGGGGSIRHLSDGRFPIDQPHDRTIYELILPATLPGVDGTLQDGAVGIMIANDAPIGGWDTIGVFCLGVPQGFIIFMTPP
ncbi:MAG: hypothetical protein LAT64_04980 [Phycisphaerales bacterium]|nr:hypothetical protein [Planctomycetota bacterium]MCH8508109.1 hypothetical protein [Phycisphaerales bacterium]